MGYFVAIFIYLIIIKVNFDVEVIKKEALESLEVDNQFLQKSFDDDESQLTEH